jgi:Fe-S cluster biogenesis protein NfuA
LNAILIILVKNNFIKKGEKLEEKVKKVLSNDIKPYLKSHGGDVKLLSVSEDGTVKVKLTGACGGCPMAQMTLKGFVEKALKAKIPEIKKVIT